MLKKTFGAAKPIIAMVHFPPLPGSPRYDAKRGMQWLVDSCAADIENLEASVRSRHGSRCRTGGDLIEAGLN